jgi:hypothetical protein
MKSKTEIKVIAAIYEIFELIFLFMAGMMLGVSLVPILSQTYKLIGYLGTLILLIATIVMNHKKQYSIDLLEKMK